MRLSLTIAMLLLGASSASAGCYDVFGCANRNHFRLDALLAGPSCELLYTMRNSIYKEHGYCFRTPRGQAMFGNEGCVTSDTEALGLNAIERENAAVIKRAEFAKGCRE